MEKQEQNNIRLANRKMIGVYKKKNDEIVIGFPVQYSNIPKLLRDYIVGNGHIWNGKKIFIIATMGLFSGDGE